jgi:Glycosyltransferase family 87
VAGTLGPGAGSPADEMTQRASLRTAPAIAAGRALAPLATRLGFVALLAASPFLPQLGNSFSSYPAVSHSWVMLPFCGLFLLPLIDVRHLRQLRHLDLLALLSFGVALGTWGLSRLWPLLFVYAPLAYLGVRMTTIARVARPGSTASSATPFRPRLPRSWLIAGIAVLAAVHIGWALEARVNTDVGYGSIRGALRLLHGQPLYGADRALSANLGYDPHYDTYGPANYEAYVPFAGVAGITTDARLATLFFDLLTAALLFALGRRVRGPTAGVTLAYAWLAFPFTVYADGLAANDAIVAAALVATLLLARSPARRGAMIAVAAWTKLTPLALVPLMAGQDSPGRDRRRALLAFGAAFMLTSLLVFAPVLSHGGASAFLTRTFGFQIGRGPGYSIWERLGEQAFGGASAWINAAGGVAHGLIIALAGAFAVALLWLPRRRDTVGLAAASAATLAAVLFCEGYYSFTYILWLAPLALAALLLDGREPDPPADRAQEMTVSSFGRAVRISRPRSATTTRSSIRTPSRPGR